MDVERALIAKVVNGQLIEQVVARGIGPQHFADESNRAVYQTITQHMIRYGAPPSRDVVLMSHPNYRLDVCSDTIEFVLDKFVEMVQNREAEKSIIDLAQRLRDPHETMSPDLLFMEYTERVARVVPNSRVARLSEAPTRIELWKQMRAKGRIPGIPLGIPSLDGIILGVQPHELCVISAPSSWGKSTLMQWICLSSYLNGPEHRPVFISLEMEADALLRKFDTMATNFEYEALRALKLGVGDLQKWEEWGERVSNAPNDIIIIDDIDECTVERVFAETLRWKPSAMFVDYFGIMTPRQMGDKQYAGMAEMAKAMKRIPRRTKIPLFTAAQTNRSGFRDGVKAENVADTIEIFRSADIMLGLEWDEEDNPGEMTVKIVKSRDSKKGSAQLDWDLDYMQIREKPRFAPVERMQTPQFVPKNAPVLSIIDNPFFQQEIGAVPRPDLKAVA